MLDDTQMWHQQQQLEQQWLERDYDIAFGSFAKDFKQFVKDHENEQEGNQARTRTPF